VLLFFARAFRPFSNFIFLRLPIVFFPAEIVTSLPYALGLFCFYPKKRKAQNIFCGVGNQFFYFKIDTKDRDYFSRVPERREGNTNLIWAQFFYRVLAGVGKYEILFSSKILLWLVIRLLV
jgi:hypothetical protein